MARAQLIINKTHLSFVSLSNSNISQVFNEGFQSLELLNSILDQTLSRKDFKVVLSRMSHVEILFTTEPISLAVL